MHVDRVQLERSMAILGFTLSFFFLLAIIALAFTATSNETGAPAYVNTDPK